MSEIPVDLDSLLQRGYRYALSLAHDPTLAEDLLQEACLRIARLGGPWRPAYLFTVIRNQTIDEHRRNQKVRFQPIVEGVEPTEDPPCERAEDLERALGRLKADERELLFLSAVEGYTTTEIAELTGRPRGTVLSVIYRTKQRLRQMLSDSARVSSAARDAS